MKKAAEYGVKHCMGLHLNALRNSVKPIVGVVRGGAHGIAFTHLSLFDFIYTSPETKFATPFMKSFQSPEGTSTYMFPKLMGKRMANEVLMLDRVLSAQEAVGCGFANGVIEDLGDSDWFDLKKVPTIGKLLATDYRTIVNCKALINKAEDKQKIDQVMEDEAQGLVDTWLDPEFPQKLQKYMMMLMEAKTKNRAKL